MEFLACLWAPGKAIDHFITPSATFKRDYPRAYLEDRGQPRLSLHLFHRLFLPHRLEHYREQLYTQVFTTTTTMIRGRELLLSLLLAQSSVYEPETTVFRSSTRFFAVANNFGHIRISSYRRPVYYQTVLGISTRSTRAVQVRFSCPPASRPAARRIRIPCDTTAIGRRLIYDVVVIIIIISYRVFSHRTREKFPAKRPGLYIIYVLAGRGESGKTQEKINRYTYKY